MKIAFVMLAAGNSRRFGANKLLYEIDGIPMYRHVLEQLDDTKKKIENIYSEYSDITEDNNNDNNSDIVQLNNLYRNNITAKIICNIIVITQYDAIAEARNAYNKLSTADRAKASLADLLGKSRII